MIAANRTAVYAIGDTPAAAEFAGRNLSLEVKTAVEDCTAPQLRAVIIFPGDLAGATSESVTARGTLKKWLNHNFNACAVRGVLVIISAAGPNIAHAAKIAEDVTKAVQQANGPTLTAKLYLRLVSTNSPARLAQACLDHDCGPAPNHKVKLRRGNGKKWVPPVEMTVMFQRAFYDFETLYVTSLSGGKSGAFVWRVDARAPDRDLCSPFVVKCAEARSIDQHVDTYRDVVADRVPYRGCAPVCVERSVRGATQRFIVSRFIENALPLSEIILTEDVRLVVQDVYRRVLARWRSGAKKRKVSPFREFISAGLLSKRLLRLQPTYAQLVANHPNVPTPERIAESLGARPAVVRPYCRAHDDLNLRNIFVAGDREAVLIDFTRAAERPLSHDCARLDVGLAFDSQLQKVQPIPDGVLQNYFSGDLFSISLPQLRQGQMARHRLEAISAIRMQLLEDAGRFEFDIKDEYTVAVATELLYHAQDARPGSGLAYLCASQLARQLDPTL